MLNYLKTLFPFSKLSLKQLTLKTIALIALTSSDRGQTIHLMKKGNMEIHENCLKFVIFDRIKTTRKKIKPSIVQCVVSEDAELCVKSHVLEYLNRTEQFRSENSSDDFLFLSWATKRKVTKQTIARWLKEALKISGINTNLYKSHSFRGASLSAAFDKGASISEIIKAGNWSNIGTFKTFYQAPPDDTRIGQLILNQAN